MTVEAHLATLHPGVASRARALLLSCATAKCPMRITQSKRSSGQQAALYAQGRRSLPEVNQLRSVAGLGALTDAGNRIVTNARPGQSMHEYGLAFDLCYAVGDPYQEENHALTWEEVGALVERAGLTWGGRFKTPDRPHGQWTGAYTEAQIREGMMPA